MEARLPRPEVRVQVVEKATAEKKRYGRKYNLASGSTRTSIASQALNAELVAANERGLLAKEASRARSRRRARAVAREARRASVDARRHAGEA